MSSGRHDDSLVEGSLVRNTCIGSHLLGHQSAPLIAQLVKNLPAVQETQVRFLGQEDPLKKRMATNSSILACRIPWMEEPGRLQSMGS